MDMLTYLVAVGAPGTDVVTRELAVTVGGVAQSPQTGDKSRTEFSVEVPQDSIVKLSLVDIDDAGNRSAASEIEFTAIDTLAPEQPGGFTVTLVSEREEEPSPPPLGPPVPEPEPTPEP